MLTGSSAMRFRVRDDLAYVGLKRIEHEAETEEEAIAHFRSLGWQGGLGHLQSFNPVTGKWKHHWPTTDPRCCDFGGGA